jgi:hypothetical protein
MRFGAFLPTYWDDCGATPIPVAINEAATAGEALGYGGVWTNNLVVSPRRRSAVPSRVSRSLSRWSPRPPSSTSCHASR